ncbi:MAG TPA: TonB-dependent receptor [Terriglobales bacterium]|nr:TonB-dependent receptor [Terriglobales bacterium]
MKRCIALLLFVPLGALAQTAPTPAQNKQQQKVPVVQQSVEVTATKTPEDPESVPAGIQVFPGDELESRGATDLHGALALAAGVEIAPGGDAGPASAVPAFWGLKEFDAFLLVVDGIPWGGSFNPALTSLNLSDVERIEVLRGPAPVTYGATSFVGVIQVVHTDVRSKDRTLELHGGAYGSGGASFSTPVPLGGSWASRLTVEGERLGFEDDRTSYRRGHGLWRVSRNPKSGTRLWFNADLNWLNQDPASPRLRDGATLSPLVPVDSNQNMAGAFLNDHRGTFMGGFDREAVGGSHWYTIISASPDRQEIFRGFLTSLENAPDNAHGFRENIQTTDFYADSHLNWKLARSLRFISGADYLHGTGRAQGADFDYTAALTGSPAAVVPTPSDLDFHINDFRDFIGAYGIAEWIPFERLRIDAGLRLNVTREDQTVIDGGEGTSVGQTRVDTRPGANVGAIFTPWQRNQDSIGLYATYRYTFKPAAIDFGIGESEGGDLILKPETARSVEGGVKGRFLDRRIEAEASGFLMNFDNLVTATNVGGVPALINAGKQRFAGFESEVAYYVRREIITRATYSFHNAVFTDFVQDFDGVSTQLAGNRVEMSPEHIAAIGIAYVPERGITANADFSYTGSRYLNMRNTALAGGFGDLGIGLGYRTSRWELRIDGKNLADRRDPIAESEFGDAQYYLLPSRRVDATFRLHF